MIKGNTKKVSIVNGKKRKESERESRGGSGKQKATDCVIKGIRREGAEEEKNRLERNGSQYSRATHGTPEETQRGCTHSSYYRRKYR